MLNENIIILLRQKFSQLLFFVRIFNHNNYTYIWNDPKIYIKFDENFMNFEDNQYIDAFVKITIETFKKFIEKKYEDMNNRLLSIIIPNYNNELTIKDTIDSILNNNYKDFEIIIIDDCSTDNSVEIIQNNYSDNPLIKLYINDQNYGTFYGRNKGILLSKGYYIANVDGDDTVHPEKFVFEINELENENKDGLKYWGYGTNFTRLFYVDNPNNIVKKSLINNKVLFTCYRKLFNYMGYYNESRYGADPEFFIIRAKNYSYNFYSNHSRNYYYALSTQGKNLTQITKNQEKINYYKTMKKKYQNNEYIEMAFLDNLPNFTSIFLPNYIQTS
jgi:glycosyltransferase involved in cell wall biosynthesis